MALRTLDTAPPAASWFPEPTTGAEGRVVSLLDADPDLGQRLDPVRAEQARRGLGARELTRGRGESTEALLAQRGGLGLLIADGLMLRCVSAGPRSGAELLGAGDVLRDEARTGFDEDPGDPPVRLHALSPLRVVVLDRSLLLRAARWPEVLEALAGRLAARAHRLAEQLAITQLTCIEDRLLRTLWRLAERWGRVRPDGVLVPPPLTHEQLGWLLGTRRPSTTTALGRLRTAGLLDPRRPGWLLTGARPPGGPDGTAVPVARLAPGC